MCHQTLYHHTGNHAINGPLVTCATLSAAPPAYQVIRAVAMIQAPCPPYASPTPTTFFYQFPSIISVPAYPYSYYTFPIQQPVMFQSPPPYTPYRPAFVHLPIQPAASLPVPAGTPTTIRYELIRGQLQPVVHYHFAFSSTERRGFNVIHGFDTRNLPPGWGVEGTSIAEAPAAAHSAESTEQPSPSVVPEPAPSSSLAPTSAPNPLTEEALTSASDSSETLVESTDSVAGTAGSEAPPAPRVRFASQPEFADEDLNSMAGEVVSEARSEMPSRPPVNW